jgi:N-acetyl-gamma-glutamyl-phosphate reductase
MTKEKITVGVYGASGYTGFETIKILRKHPQVHLAFATSEASAGKTIGDIYPVTWDVPLVAAESAPLDGVEAVFCCLPHGASMPTVIAARNAGVRVIDLSADFRLANAAVYEQWYNVPHESAELLDQAVYGLPELFAAEISETDLLANPGCYPTSVLLALAPLLNAGLVDDAAPLIADSKSGVSGAGRKASLTTHFVEVNENLSPYNIGQKHRHVAEMAQTITVLGGNGERLVFSPHLVPISRGMLSTIYVMLNEDVSAAQAQALFEQQYAASAMVHVLPAGQLATMAHTRDTNLAVMSVTSVNPRLLVLCSSIDNLGKGAAGQAVQNFNLMFGLDEVSGLV